MLACSAPPAEHARWTLRLLAETLIELGIVEYLSHVTVCEHLKNALQPRRTGRRPQVGRHPRSTWPRWRTCGMCISVLTIRCDR